MNSDRTKQAVHLALYYFANPYNRQEKFFKKKGVTHESCNVWNKSMPGLRRGRRNFKRERNPISVYGIFRQYRISVTFPHTPRHKPDF